MGELERSGAHGLNSIASRINEAHRACEEAAASAVGHAIRAGELLIEAKAEAGHGNWLPWLEQNFEGSEDTAQVYMKLARRKDELPNTEHARDLTSIRGALRALEPPKESGEGKDVAWAEEMPTLEELEAKASGALRDFEGYNPQRRARAVDAWTVIALRRGISPQVVQRGGPRLTGILREVALSLMLESEEIPHAGGTFDRSVDYLEEQVRPRDLLPSRERFVLERKLTHAEMFQTIGQLRRDGRFECCPPRAFEEEDE